MEGLNILPQVEIASSREETGAVTAVRVLHVVARMLAAAGLSLPEAMHALRCVWPAS